MRFSQRAGIVPSTKAIQIGSIDDDLRNSLWSLLSHHYWDTFDRQKYRMGRPSLGRADHISGSNLDELFSFLWRHYFKKPTDTIPELFYDGGGYTFLRSYFFEAKWYEIFDFIEFISEHGPSGTTKPFIESCNQYLEKENSGYRFVDGKIIEISSSEEVGEIEKAIEASTPYYGVKQHLNTAVSLLSDSEILISGIRSKNLYLRLRLYAKLLAATKKPSSEKPWLFLKVRENCILH